MSNCYLKDGVWFHDTALVWRREIVDLTNKSSHRDFEIAEVAVGDEGALGYEPEIFLKIGKDRKVRIKFCPFCGFRL